MITFRRPHADEAEVFAALHVACWRESLPGVVPEALLATFSTAARLPLWREVIADQERFVLGAYENDRAVGFIISGPTAERYIENQDGHLAALYMLNAVKGQGLGRTLTHRALEDWAARGGKTMTVGVLAANLPARRFYERLGARLVSQGTYDWSGHKLPDCIYVWDDVAMIARQGF